MANETVLIVDSNDNDMALPLLKYEKTFEIQRDIGGKGAVQR